MAATVTAAAAVRAAMVRPSRKAALAASASDGDEFKVDETLQSDALLFGADNYEVFAASWPSR